MMKRRCCGFALVWSASLFIWSSVAAAECPAVLTEAAAAGDPPHSARVLVQEHEACPAVEKVVAVLYAGEERVTGRTFYADQLSEETLAFPVVAALEAPNIAGIYRIDWQTIFVTGETQQLNQTFTVPCPAPAEVTLQWRDADSTLTFEAPPGDACEGASTATLTLSSVAGEVVVEALETGYHTADGQAAEVVLELPELAGEQRYVGELTLANAAKRSATVPVEFVTGCGGLEPEVTIADGRMLGSVQASDCQYPISMKLRVLHGAGEVVETADALLKNSTFDFELPGYETWPAGSYTVDTQFVGSTARARTTAGVEVECADPALSEPEILIGDGEHQAEIAFSLTGRQLCQDETRLSVQARDVDRVVVFNRAVDLPAGAAEESFRWPFLGIPGSRYEVSLRVAYGLNGEETVTRSDPVAYACEPPEILDLGFANPDGTHAAGLVAMAGCNAPATANLVVRNVEGRVVADTTPNLHQDAGTAFARIEPVSLGHLGGGVYDAELTVVDNQGRKTTQQATLLRDMEGPEIEFTQAGQRIESGDVPTIASLEELRLRFSDANALLKAFERVDQVPPQYEQQSDLSIQRIDGETTPQMWITGVVELPREAADWGLVGVLVASAAGGRWLAPVSRTFVPSEASALEGFHPSRQRIGFRAVAHSNPLDSGRYDVLGLVLAGTDGEQRLVPGSGAFTVSTLAGQRHDAILRQGVMEIPVALDWSGRHVAHLERVRSVPDGDYTLSVVGRDVYGNPSRVYSQVLRLDQRKQTAALSWPAITGYRRTYDHRFRDEARATDGPLRVLYRRVSGHGDVRINGRDVTDQASEDILEPGPNGVFRIGVELLESEVNARFVLHPDSASARPLEIHVETYQPRFVAQRTRDDSADLLTIEHVEQPCTHVVFDELSRLSLRPDEVLCAVRLNIPGASVLSTSRERTQVRLPVDVVSEAIYEEGFVRLVDGRPTFKATRQVPIKEMEAYSATPQLEFIPLDEWRQRSREGKLLSGIGDRVAGHLVVRAGLGEPVVEVDGQVLEVPPGSGDTIRIPLRTAIRSSGGLQTLTVRAFYPETPDQAAVRQFEFLGAPAPLRLEAIRGEFIAPGDLGVQLELRAFGRAYDATVHGAHKLAGAQLIARDDPSRVLPSPTVQLDGGNLEVAFPGLEPGDYRLRLVLENADPRFSSHLAPIRTDTPFEILDGSPIEAKVFTFRSADRIPFFGQLSVDVPEKRRRDVASVAWEISRDGASFDQVHCCGHSTDFALTEPGTVHYRARITNRHSDAVSHTEAMKISAFPSGTLNVLGPRATFRGFPADYTVEGLPEGYDVLWRVTSPNATRPREVRASTFTIEANETGTYYVEVVADTATDDPDSVSALRTFLAVKCSWPRIPASAIAGPTRVEYSKSYTYTVTHPPIFPERGNPAVRRVGHWELPDGTKVDDDEWAQFTLRSLPEGYSGVDILYHSWLEGDRTTITTAVHRIEPVSYRWPNWTLNVQTTSLEPPSVLRLSVAPEDWRQWMGLGATDITTHWNLPEHVRVLARTATEAIVYTLDDRLFDVTARVTDTRGNVTDLRRSGVRPVRRVPFEISLRAVAERTLHTAPIDITAHVDPIVVPKGHEITRVAYYVDGLYRGVSDGSPITLQIRTPGSHELRAVAVAGANEYSADDSITLDIGENHQADCHITPVGDFRLNGLVKAECDDPDGHMVEYRWYADGKLLSDGGTRAQLSRSERVGVRELSLIAVDNAGLEAQARYVPPQE